MKTPISYYGGKQQLAATILKLIPQHTLYCEPFFGGGAVFFAKQSSPIEVINDTNDALMNFYQVVKTNFEPLEKLIQVTLFSRTSYRHAKVIYDNPDMFDEVKRAWSIWYLANCSFGHKLNGGWRQSATRANAPFFTNRKEDVYKSAQRLERVEIENLDALQVIKARDSASSFFYVDPPYVGANQGHYDGYSQEDFSNLLETLSTIQGKFLLSSYPNEALKTYSEKLNWYQAEIKVHLAMSNSNGSPRTKLEVLTANYPLDDLNSIMVSDKLF